MNILYLGFWSIEESLTTSTIFPNLTRLANYQSIEKIIFSTIERDKRYVNYSGPQSDKIIFEPLYSQNLKIHLVTKIVDFLLFPMHLRRICKKYNIDMIIARGAPSGALAYKISKVLKIPFVVESFEPHADYMKESGIWSKNSLKYLFETKWENQIKRHAAFIAVVSNNYADQLEKEGVRRDKIHVVPCCVDLEKFKFSEEKRLAIRKDFKIRDNQIAGIYVGKFGGTYYDEESFDIFCEAFDFFNKNMFLVILTPHDKEDIENKLIRKGIPRSNFFVDKVPHEDVPGYLSAGDFAFSTVRPSPSKKFCSAVKNGEYWANGLPILTTDGIGDDTNIMRIEANGGAIFDLSKDNLLDALKDLNALIQNRSREQLNVSICGLAKKHRNFKIAHEFYDKLFENGQPEKF